MVKSQSGNGEYLVTREFVKRRDAQHRHDWTCSCPDHTTRNVICKHIFAVQFSLKLKDDVEQGSNPNQLEATESSITCPHCKSTSIGKWGNRKTKFGIVQRYICQDCNYTFVVDKGFCKM